MRGGSRLAVGLTGAIALGLLLLAPAVAFAFDRFLDHVEADGRHLIIQFTCEMAYVSHFPLRAGGEVRIELQPLAGCPAGNGYSESLPTSGPSGSGFKALRLESGIGSRRALIITLWDVSDYIVRPLPGLTGIELVLAPRHGSTTVETTSAPPNASRAATRALPSQPELDRLEAAAMKAMRDKDYDSAIRLYTKLLEYPEHAGRARAQEYLGLARERKGELAQAKREYEEYLRRYPEGPDSVEVGQRLAALATLEGRSRAKNGDADARWQWQGAVSQEYRHDQNTLTQDGVTASGIGQSALYSEADVAVRHRGDAADFAARLDAGYLHDFGTASASTSGSTRISAAYAEWTDAGHRYLARMGRQSAVSGGVYGVFDGAYGSWRLNPLILASAAVGAPLQVYSPQLSAGRTFASAGLEFIDFVRGMDAGIYLLEQRASGHLDERELGTDLRYHRDGRSLVVQANYDASYQVVNAATALGTWALPDRWILTFTLDHRKAPFISTYNALTGQPTTSLDALFMRYGETGVRQLARDRTANSDSYTVGFQRPLGERLQWWTNIAYNKLGAMPASGGVAAVPSIGGLTIYSTQILGSGWYFDRDTHTLGASLGNGAGTRNVSFFLSDRYAVSDRLRVGPRLTVNDTKTDASAQTGLTNGLSASPSLLLEWQVKHGGVQFETGYEKTNQTLLGGNLISPTPVPPPPSSAGPGPASIQTSARRLWLSLAYHLEF